ncbi:MAG TPA: hypothetical protein VNT52_17585 [Acidimicrobiales bacterium]|jgi:hypothetical protein|nr:hypothetical protein [Acidimicrobiales bacterium]
MALLAVATLPSDTGMAADAVTNQFAVAGPSALDAGAASAIAAAVRDFYITVPTGQTQRVRDMLSPVLDNGTDRCTVDVYDISNHLDGSPHGSPIFTLPFTLAAPNGGTALPSEVAIVASLHAVDRSLQRVSVPDGPPGPTGDTRPRQRFTGRIYVGPLNTQATDAASGTVRVSSIASALIRQGILTLARNIRSNSPVLANLGIWSRADATVRAISHVKVDNAFDTQRRRGERASSAITTTITYL